MHRNRIERLLRLNRDSHIVGQVTSAETTASPIRATSSGPLRRISSGTDSLFIASCKLDVSPWTATPAAVSPRRPSLDLSIDAPGRPHRRARTLQHRASSPRAVGRFTARSYPSGASELRQNRSPSATTLVAMTVAGPPLMALSCSSFNCGSNTKRRPVEIKVASAHRSREEALEVAASLQGFCGKCDQGLLSLERAPAGNGRRYRSGLTVESPRCIPILRLS